MRICQFMCLTRGFVCKVFYAQKSIIISRLVVSMCYYGVTMYAGTIGGNFFLNFFLLAIIEFPSYINIPMLECLGRKWTHVFFMWLGGFACIGTIFTVVYGGDGMKKIRYIQLKYAVCLNVHIL